MSINVASFETSGVSARVVIVSVIEVGTPLVEDALGNNLFNDLTNT